MERAKLLACIVLYRRLKRRRRNRMHWVHPVNMRREEAGAFFTLFEDLRNDGDKFFNYFSMRMQTFDDLYGKIKDSIRRNNTSFRECIQPMQMLAVTIRYLASGCTFTELHFSYKLGISTISKIVRDVCQAIWVLRNECIPIPKKDDWENISKQFEQRSNFPHCIGAVDGKHIHIVKPCNSMYYNSKGFSSILLMAVSNSNYQFTYVDIGRYGKDGDSTIFKECSLWKLVLSNEFEFPEEKCLPGTENPKVPYFFVADEAFGLHKHLLRPFGGNKLTIEKKIFNYRLSRAHRYVECAFGIMSNKWRIFHRTINLDPDFATYIVKACVVLHNFVIERDSYSFEDTLSITGIQSLSRSENVRGGISANNVRKTMMDYFSTPIGSIKWQYSKI